MKNYQDIIEKLDLKPHPEGGYFRETYRSSGEIPATTLGPEYSGNRSYCTCIYFLLTSASFSAFHRIKQDEIWHYYAGSPIRLHIISESGKHTHFIVGNDIAKGERPQEIVSGGDWFAAEVVNPNAYTLVGCTVAPGFSFEDFDLPSRDTLLSKFPQHTTLITNLTHS